MTRKVLFAKVHMAACTATHPDYSGSLGVDREILHAARLRPHDAVLVANCRSGARFETYLIPLPAGSRRVEVKGAAARLVEPGDRLILIHFAMLSDDEYAHHKPRVLVMGADNHIEQVLDYDAG